MNKKFTITLLGTVAVCTLCATSVFATEGKITGNSVRMRLEASTKASIVDTIDKNAKVEVLSESNNWYKVSYKNKEGYIYKDYIEVDTESENTVENSDEKASNESSKIGNILNSDANLYLTACYSSSKIGDIKKNTKIKLEKTISNWSYVSYSNLYGWIPNYKLMKTESKVEENAKVEDKQPKKETEVSKINKKAYLSSGPANLRKGPGTNYSTIGGIAKNESITVLEEEKEWYKIKTSDNITGYVLKSLVTLGEKKTTSRSSVKRDVKEEKAKEVTVEKKQEDNNTKVEEDKKTLSKEEKLTEKRKELVKFAKKYLGYKYVHGSASPKTGFDCSGFTKYVYGHFGYKLSRSASSQGKEGKHVDKDKLKLGDLLIFTGHVGIYIGDNKFIHASNPSDGVKITSLSNSYYVRNYKDARRIIK